MPNEVDSIEIIMRCNTVIGTQLWYRSIAVVTALPNTAIIRIKKKRK